VAFRAVNRGREPGWHNAPVPAFGGLDARLLVLGLAPGLRGANRTGRPFTGDHAGRLLYATLLRHGFAAGDYAEHAGDGLRLVDCRVSNAVRCVPPDNKPTGSEIAACRPFLRAELTALRNLAAVLALGRIAHDQLLLTLGLSLPGFPFGHGVRHALPSNLALYDSYHCSRYNTQTGRLTAAMFDSVLARIRRELP
jgi:uracil-DNA glycosylase family 4